MAGCIQNENPHFGEWRENAIGVKIFKPYYVSSQKIYVKRDSVFFLAVMPTGFGLGAGELFNVFVVFLSHFAMCRGGVRCCYILEVEVFRHHWLPLVSLCMSFWLYNRFPTAIRRLFDVTRAAVGVWYRVLEGGWWAPWRPPYWLSPTAAYTVYTYYA